MPMRVKPLFDYEKLDVYRVGLAFIAWIAAFLGDVAQSWVLVPVLRFPNRLVLVVVLVLDLFASAKAGALRICHPSRYTGHDHRTS
jgi:hypothetical protein